jgi:hypothetical protein
MKIRFLFQEAFFNQHNCQTKDIQQKYNSRAAQLYREKLHQLATKAMKQYGNKVKTYQMKHFLYSGL